MLYLSLRLTFYSLVLGEFDLFQIIFLYFQIHINIYFHGSNQIRDSSLNLTVQPKLVYKMYTLGYE